MPELPEVEHFRQVLLPLATPEYNKDKVLHFVSTSASPPKVWPSTDEISYLNDKQCCCIDVLRKGKQLCMVLQEQDKSQYWYFYLHMGMTGHIKTPGRVTQWGSSKFTEYKNQESAEVTEQVDEKDKAEVVTSADEVTEDVDTTTGTDAKAESVEEVTSTDGTSTAVFQPKYTYLTITTLSYKTAFVDPRKFGKCYLEKAEAVTGGSKPYSTPKAFELLAPDALNEVDDNVATTLANQSRGAKAILLDQNRVVAGVGNWIADEVFYQCQIHPDQAYLTLEEAKMICKKLVEILQIAVDCLATEKPYPKDWLFSHRWTKKKESKDSLGRKITFITSGGRTSGIIASQQKLYKRKGVKSKENVRKSNTKISKKRKNEVSDDDSDHGHGEKVVKQRKKVASKSSTKGGDEMMLVVSATASQVVTPMSSDDATNSVKASSIDDGRRRSLRLRNKTN